MMIKKYIIKEQECGYLMKDGRFVGLLTAGRYSYLNTLGYGVQTVPMIEEVRAYGIPEETLVEDERLASRVMKVVLPDECIALRFMNKAYREMITKSEILCQSVFEKNEFRLIDIAQPYMEDILSRMYMGLMPSKYYKKIVIKNEETGLPYFNNCCGEKPDMGTYYFWNYGREATCKVFNMRIQRFDTSSQEILTVNKVTIRLNIVCNCRITSPEGLVQTVRGVASQLHTYTQPKLRGYMRRYRLDELLEQKEETGRFVLDKLKEYQEEYYVRITEAGIKDITFPGEIREVMNIVLMAEKKTRANVIMRQKEAASTRSLLGTARLIDEDRTLFKLKEMEYLEKICDKADNISPNGGEGMLKQPAELARVQD